MSYINGTDKIHLKCDVIAGSILKGKRHLFYYMFGLDEPFGHQNI